MSNIKTNLFEVDITDSFIVGKLIGKIEALQELLDMGINNKSMRQAIEFKKQANEKALEILQNPTKM